MCEKKAWKNPSLFSTYSVVGADRSLGIDPMAKFDLPEDYNPCGRKTEEDDFTENGIDEVFE